ncbi:nucleotide sugar dehydrogenase [Desulfobacterales bacterium HSG16]|nr:nucleotide sugar dehydrogenase [Desulfobacterales bacterium HSG16]
MITFESLCEKKDRIAVLGLGYVGLPLAVHLSGYFEVTGYDLNTGRIEELRAGHDRTLEIDKKNLLAADIFYTSNAEDLSECRLIIVAVPTPIDEYRIPDLNPLKSASSIVGKNIKKGSCIVFESTVFPGATEDVCVPIIAHESNMLFGKDFTAGYSPERINPGDKVHTLDKIIKIVSGSDQKTCLLLQKVYGKIITAGLHVASSIKVAEAAKVIENTQRDLNIALMNELAMIFDKMDIDTLEVLKAAGTKWNFLDFRPGLVGGHCIGVDPYYLTFKAESIGYHPEMILAGRRINDGMAKVVAEQTIKMLFNLRKSASELKVAILGLTFKENVPDLRNTRVIDIINELKEFGIDVLVHDPLAEPLEAKKYYGLDLQSLEKLKGVDAVILAVNHIMYEDMGLEGISQLCSGNRPLVIDIKSIFGPEEAKQLNIDYWRL